MLHLNSSVMPKTTLKSVMNPLSDLTLLPYPNFNLKTQMNSLNSDQNKRDSTKTTSPNWEPQIIKYNLKKLASNPFGHGIISKITPQFPTTSNYNQSPRPFPTLQTHNVNTSLHSHSPSDFPHKLGNSFTLTITKNLIRLHQ